MSQTNGDAVNAPGHHVIPEKKVTFQDHLKKALSSWQLYLMILPLVAFFIVFHYMPMYGVVIAFKDFTPAVGIWQSPWVGLKHFRRFFSMHYAPRLIWNTLALSLYSLVAGFPMPIILALAFNEMKDGRLKKFVQTVTYAPNFISTVVIVGMVITFLSPSTGIINNAIQFFGGTPKHFMEDPRWFRHIYVLSGIWQGTGWGTVIYLAALSGVDEQLHESAMIDGASRLQRLWYINIPVLIPTMTIILIMNFGSVMSVGFEKALLMQNPLNMATSDIIATFTYRTGLLEGQYSYSAAIGLFNSIINSILLISVNWLADKYSEASLF